MSRNLEALDPETQARARRWLAACEDAGLDVLVTCTTRTFAEQTALYAVGRTTPGNRCKCGKKLNPIGTCPKHPKGLTVTKAKAGESEHNWKRAIDFVPMRHGKPIWETNGNGIDENPLDDETDNLELWQRIAQLAKAEGFEWGGDWKSFPDMPHLQYVAGRPTWRQLLTANPRGFGV